MTGACLLVGEAPLKFEKGLGVNGHSSECDSEGNLCQPDRHGYVHAFYAVQATKRHAVDKSALLALHPPDSNLH